ncbi:MAG: hypothetical protein ABJN24_06545 [Hyphomicrobiales bacterium]
MHGKCEMPKDPEAHARQIKHLKHEPKLTIDDVDAIRREYVYQSRDHGIPALAKKYGVARNTIHKIIRGKTWKADVRFGHAPLPDGKNRSYKQEYQEMLANTCILAATKSLWG